MADQRCPKCGLWNTETALRCDCGYDFAEGAVSNGNWDKRNVWNTIIMVIGFAWTGAVSALFGFLLNYSFELPRSFKWTVGIGGLFGVFLGISIENRFRNRPGTLFLIVGITSSAVSALVSLGIGGLLAIASVP